jgi:hypothetical protein
VAGDAPTTAVVTSPTEVTADQATLTAEELAARNAAGEAALRQPSDATAMSFQSALSAIGSSPDYSLAPSAPVWLIHVYAEPASGISRPPSMATAPQAGPALADAETTTTAPPILSYYAIIDGASGRLVVEAI